jgi:dTDP-4-amino-4,6-dideoxygalactose transaminase
MQRVNLIKVHYRKWHVWKYHKETPLYNEYMLMEKEEEGTQELSLLSFPSLSLSQHTQTEKWPCMSTGRK